MRAQPAAALAVCLTIGLTFARPTRAQPLAARAAAAEGAATLRYAARPAACGDGRGFVALGDFMSADGASYGHGWSRRDGGATPCLPGPARVTLTVRGGAVVDVRLRVGPAGPGAADAGRDLGAVGAAEAAAYFLALAGRRDLPARAADQAVAAAAVADSADVWRPLLALARGGAAGDAPDGRDDGGARVARTAMHWLGAVAPPAAVPTLAALLRDPAERRVVREGAAQVLARVPDGAGVPPLAAAARGERAAGGGDAWVRERAVFWLGTADDARARTTVRTLAAADTADARVRRQAIFAIGHLGGRWADDAGNAAFLRALYPRLASDALRDGAVQAVAQADDPASRRWLLDLAADAAQPLEARKRALFWAGQQRAAAVGDLVALDARLTGAELRRHYTFVLSQRPEDAAVDRLIAIARADADRGVRRQAIFWLGQSRSPRARAYLEDVVAR